MNDLLKKYQQLENTLRIIEAEKSELRDKIVSSLHESNLEKFDHPEYGKLTLAKKSSWIYTAKIKIREEKLKVAKLKEEQSGKAERTEKEYLMYTVPKSVPSSL